MHRSFLIHWQNCRYLADRINVIFQAIERQAELEELIAWAKDKKLKHPLRFYRIRLQDEEQKLASYRMRFPGLFKLCEWWRTLTVQLKGNRPRFIKGTAAKYRLVPR